CTSLFSEPKSAAALWAKEYPAAMAEVASTRLSKVPVAEAEELISWLVPLMAALTSTALSLNIWYSF
ncbi:hypothetical protein ACQ1P5_11705, partial [Ornithobacterium rhinotracheale]